MKKFLLIIGLIFTLSISVFASGNNEVTVVLDGETLNFDVPAQIIDGRTMVPMRAIFEKLGAEVEWNDGTKTIVAYKPGILMAMQIYNTTVSRNMVHQIIDVPPLIINDRTLVPIRIISEYMGADVSWEQKTQTVYITSTNKIQYIDWNDNCYYWGEVSDGEAMGYGILYSKNDGYIIELGKFIESQIVAGTTYYDNGNSFSGNYQNNTMHGYGTYYYTDGSILDGNWASGLPHGICTFYDAQTNTYSEGNYTNGLRNGDFVITDLSTNTTYTKSFINDNEVVAIPITPSSTTSLESYLKELEELDKWYDEEAAEIEEFANSDPLDTSWGKSIMKTYKKQAQSVHEDTNAKLSSMTGGFSNSNSLAASKSAYEERIEAGESLVLDMFDEEIENRWESLDKLYENKKSALKIKYGINY